MWSEKAISKACWGLTGDEWATLGLQIDPIFSELKYESKLNLTETLEHRKAGEAVTTGDEGENLYSMYSSTD